MIKRTISERRAARDYNRWRGIKKKNHKKKKQPAKKVSTDYLTIAANKLKGKPYKTFLKSDYWTAVRAKILTRDNHQCTNCKSKTGLEVHHSTYKHHFMEHKYLIDLHTLCGNCHYNIHCLVDIK